MEIYIVKNEAGDELYMSTNYDRACEEWDRLSDECGPVDLVVEQ